MISLLADEAITSWKEKEAARAKRSRSAFLARMGSLVTQREAKMDVLRQRRYSLERRIDRVGVAKRDAEAEVRRVMAAGRASAGALREHAACRVPPSSSESAAAAAAAAVHQPMEQCRSPGARLVPPVGAKVVLSTKHTSTQVLEWINTGRRPQKLVVVPELPG